MLFKTTEQHEKLREELREFLEEELAPIVVHLDQDNEFPREVVGKLREKGIFGIPFPKEYGGMGLDTISYAIGVEEMGRIDAGTAVIFSAHASLCASPIYEFGTEEQKQKYLVPLANGEKLGAFGLTEDEAGSDAGGLQTTAVLEGDHYILNGSKIFISNAPEADTYVIFALTTENIGTRGISAFIVEKDWEGFTFGERYDKMGIRSSATNELLFNNVKVPKENLLGKEGDGFKIAMITLDGGRIGVAAQALGIGQGAYESALEYSKDRVQFGRPIAQQQAISFMLADMAMELDAARLLIYKAAGMKDRGERFAKEAAMAKLYASENAVRTANKAVQIWGGSGFIKGMDVERFYRDAKITTIYEGTSEIMRVVIAANIIGPMPKADAAPMPKRGPATGFRKKKVFTEGTIEERVDELIEALEADGHDFTQARDFDMPVSLAERVVSAGKGIGDKENIELIEDLARSIGGTIGASRPIAETLRYLPMDRYVGMSGQKFTGNLYVAVGISGAGQHLKGIKNAGTIVAINKDPNARIFKNADYGLVGDFKDIVPVLIEKLNEYEKEEAGPMVKIKRPAPKKPEPTWDFYVCNGCGHEYDPAKGDPEADIYPGTLFTDLPDEWTCPKCGEEKDVYILAR